MLLFLIFGLVFMSSVIIEGKFRNLFCTLYDKEYGEFINCRIKAINRYRNSINIFYRQIYPAEDAVLRLEFFKRANGWRPFLYNFTFNLCDLLQRKTNFLSRLAYSYVKPFLILNYTCPFKTNDWVKCDKFELDLEQIRNRFPIDTGEYAAQITFYYKSVRKITINGSMEYSNYREP